MLSYFSVLYFFYVISISGVSSRVIKVPNQSQNATEIEIGNFTDNFEPATKGNVSGNTNSSLPIHSPMISFGNHSIMENESLVTRQSSQTSNKTVVLANITIHNSSSLIIIDKKFHNTSKVNISSVATEFPEANISSVATESPTQNLTTSQSIIHQKKNHSKRFVKNLPTFDVTDLFHHIIALKFQYLQRASGWENINQTQRNDCLSQRQIKSIFRIAKFGTPSLLRCNQPESTIMIKCFSNIARVTLTSDNEDRFDAKILLDRKNQTNRKFTLDGYKHIFYLVWWERDNGINLEFNPKLTREMIERKCESCKRMEAMFKLENENEVCLIPVNCEDPNNQIIKLDNSKSSIVNFIRNIPIFSSSITLQEFAHDKASIKQEFSFGATVDIVIEATSDVMPIEVYVRECRIRSGLNSDLILVNGCSISSFLDNFRIMKWSNNKKFVLSAKFIPFSIENSSKNYTLGCTIMICEGICHVQSSCQNHLGERNIKHSKFVTDAHIQTTYKVFPDNKKTQELSKLQSGNQSRERKIIKGRECVDANSSIAMKICYLYLVLLSLLFILLISVMFIYLRQQKRKRNKTEEEIESPQRIIYQEECQTRRRSPNNSLIKY